MKGVSLDKQFGTYVRNISLASLKKLGKDVLNAGEFENDRGKYQSIKGFRMIGEVMGRVYIITML